MVSLEHPQAACSTGVPHGQGLVPRCRQDAGVILQKTAIKVFFPLYLVVFTVLF